MADRRRVPSIGKTSNHDNVHAATHLPQRRGCADTGDTGDTGHRGASSSREDRSHQPTLASNRAHSRHRPDRPHDAPGQTGLCCLAKADLRRTDSGLAGDADIPMGSAVAGVAVLVPQSQRAVREHADRLEHGLRQRGGMGVAVDRHADRTIRRARIAADPLVDAPVGRYRDRAGSFQRNGAAASAADVGGPLIDTQASATTALRTTPCGCMADSEGSTKRSSARGGARRTPDASPAVERSHVTKRHVA